MAQRYFLYLSYNGTAYCGWQIQPNGNSIQEELAKALSTILRVPIQVVGAGRTDTGVHAKRMVAHFDAPNEIVNLPKFVSNLNSFLPTDIAIEKIEEVQDESHARFDALSRRYEYHAITHKSPFHNHLAARINAPLDFDKMNEAANVLFEYEDFTSFSKLHTDAKTNNCKILRAQWNFVGDEWVFTIEANRFLRNMVRAIVGTLFEVGKGTKSVADFRAVIEAKDRCKAGHSVPACGLYLVDVTYPPSVF